jgi:hypothetical protein
MRNHIPTKISPRHLPCGSRRDWTGGRYQDWRALEKLEYVDELMRSLAGKPPLPMPEYQVADYDCLNVKLKTYYAKKRKEYEHSFPDFYDNDLRQLFDAGENVEGRVKASVYLRRHRRDLENAVCQVDQRKQISRQQAASES